MRWSHLFTGKDNETQDMARWSWAISTLATTGFAMWNAVHAGTVALMEYAQAISLIVAAHGGALWAKKDTEPAPK